MPKQNNERDYSVSKTYLAAGIYNGNEALFDASGKPWMTRRQIAQALDIDVSTVTRTVRRLTKKKIITNDDTTQVKTLVNSGKVYIVHAYSVNVLETIALMKNQSREVRNAHPTVQAWLENRYKNVKHHVHLPLGGIVDFICDDVVITEVKVNKFTASHLSQLNGYINQLHYLGREASPLLVYFMDESPEVDFDFCRFCNVNDVAWIYWDKNTKQFISRLYE